MIPRHLQIAFALLLIALVGGGVYMYQLKRRDERNLAHSSESRPVSAPVNGPKTLVKLAIAYDDDGVITRRETAAALPEDEAGRAREVLRSVIAEYTRKPAPHVLAEGTDVRAVYFIDGLCVVDMTPQFAGGHRSGVLLEEFTVLSLVETLSMNVPAVKSVKFLVDGKDRETLAGHADLQTIYDVQAVHAIVDGLNR